jgi:transcription elongation factor GreA
MTAPLPIRKDTTTMTSTERVWMTQQAHTRLQTELAALHSRPSIEIPDDFMDYDDNIVASYAARQARIRQIQDLLTNAVVGEDPPDDAIAEPGMVLAPPTCARGPTPAIGN